MPVSARTRGIAPRDWDRVAPSTRCTSGAREKEDLRTITPLFLPTPDPESWAET